MLFQASKLTCTSPVYIIIVYEILFSVSLSNWFALHLFNNYRCLRITGKDVTPFMLKKVNELMDGKSLEASILFSEYVNIIFHHTP